MSIDKELYRKAYDQYRQWNEARAAERARNAGRLSPAQAWRQYIELVEFCWQLQPRQSRWQREKKLAAWEGYYDRIQRLEAWRRARGKKA